MTGTVFTNTLRRNWRSALYWGISIALLGLYVIVVIPDIDVLQQYAGLINNMPPVLLNALGITDTSQIATPEGFLAIGFFGYIMLVLAAYGVIAGLNVSANDEDRGTLDLVLSLPIPRWRVVLERFLAFALIIVFMLALTAASETAAAALRVLSFFRYYDGGHIMNTGLQWGNVLVLVVASVILIAGSLWFFQRRDIGL